jgi:hypothetical protein
MVLIYNIEEKNNLFNREGRKAFTQRTQSYNLFFAPFAIFSLRSLRLKQEKSLETMSVTGFSTFYFILKKNY